MGQNRSYKFCFLLSLDLWTFYLGRILFLKGCGILFWECLSSTRIFNGCNIISKCGKDSLMFQNPFLTTDANLVVTQPTIKIKI
jgi:hypothetical protein